MSMGRYHQLLASTAIPWRLRNFAERWVEGVCRERLTGLYRTLHLGSAANVVSPLTRGPAHHFFGYYDKSPWNASGRYVLAHEASFNDRVPTKDDIVQIGVIDLEAGRVFEALSRSGAWNWQQGAMLQWDPQSPESRFTFNDIRKGQFVGVIQELSVGEIQVVGRPIYA